MRTCIICGTISRHKYCKTCYKKSKHKVKCILCDNITKSNKDKYCEDCKKFRTWATSRIFNKKYLGMDIKFSIEWLAGKARNTTHCELCGHELDYNAGKDYSCYASLDRINNEIVLTEDNVWIVCYRCNTTKSNRTLTEFIDYCELITKRWRT